MNTAIEMAGRIWQMAQTELFDLDQVKVTPWVLVELVGLTLLLVWCAPKLNALIIKRIHASYRMPRDFQKVAIRILRIVLMLVGFAFILHVTGLESWLYNGIERLYTSTQSVLELKLFKLGKTQLTLLTFVYLLIASWLLVRSAGQLHVRVIDRVLAKTKLDVGGKQAVGMTIHYFVLFLGFVVLLQTAGIDLSALTVMLGALGIGMSLGLQNITSSFISGLIIIFERPIKLGDLIQVGDLIGKVEHISLRATMILTSANIAVVVPNSQLVSSNVINWTHSGGPVRLKFSCSVSSDLEPHMMEKLILDAAGSLPGVVNTPAPAVFLEELSKDQMKFSIELWTQEFMTQPEALASKLNFAIFDALSKSGVSVNFAPSSTNTMIGQPSVGKPG